MGGEKKSEGREYSGGEVKVVKGRGRKGWRGNQRGRGGGGVP